MILFISHKKSQCGIYQYGLDVYNSLKKSLNYNFVYIESDTLNDIISFINMYQKKIKCIVYNYYPTTMPWINTNILRKFSIKQIAIIHEFNQETIDKLNNNYFDAFLIPDPTINIAHTYIYKINRLIPNFEKEIVENNNKISIGSFGFGFKDKGFEKIIEIAKNEFKDVEIDININMPFNTIVDIDGKNHAIKTKERCLKIIEKSKINLKITHNYMEKKDLLNFLHKNTINAFFYDTNKDMGISSVIDFALAVKKPIAITKSGMFRHIFNVTPSICIEDSNFQTIIKRGVSPFEKIYEEWSEENFIKRYEEILDIIL